MMHGLKKLDRSDWIIIIGCFAFVWWTVPTLAMGLTLAAVLGIPLSFLCEKYLPSPFRDKSR